MLCAPVTVADVTYRVLDTPVCRNGARNGTPKLTLEVRINVPAGAVLIPSPRFDEQFQLGILPWINPEPTCFSLETAALFSSLSQRTHLPFSEVWQPMKNTLHKGFAIVLAVSLFAAMLSKARAADYVGYKALDQKQPVSFDGKTVKWNGKTFTLDDNTIFLDSRLDRAQLAGNSYAFNTLKDAAAALKNGTANKPMLLLTAPGVYWVDNPDDPAIRSGVGAPVGMTIACNYLYLYGLNTSKENVVFAVNRGQTQGAAGNFTMFSIRGNGLKSENVTFGNYCNVDLKFPLDPTLNRAKRGCHRASPTLLLQRQRRRGHQ